MIRESFAAFWLSRMAVAALVVYLSSAVRLWRLAPGVKANRVAAMLCATLAVWALQAAASYAADAPAVTVALARTMSWSWAVFPALALRLALELAGETGAVSPARKRAIQCLAYAAALLFSYLVCGPLLRGAVRRAGYWSVDMVPGLGYTAFSAYYLIANLAGMALVGLSLSRAETRWERRRLIIIMATHAVALAGGFTTDTVLEAARIDFPKVGVLWGCAWAFGLIVAMERYDFLSPFTPRERGLLIDRFIERSMDGIAVISDDDRVIYWNEPLAELTGIPQHQARGANIDDLERRLLPPGTREHALSIAIQAPSQATEPPGGGAKASGLVEFEIRRADGMNRWLQASAFVVPTSAGRTWAVICRDITEQRRAAEAALERLRRQAHAQKMEALGSLAAGIAHDFNNALGGIVGAASLIGAKLEGNACGLDIGRELSLIRQSSARAASSVRGLTSFATEAPRRHEALRLDDAIRNVVSFAGHSMGKEVAIAAEEPLPVAVAVGDPALIEQLLLNLVINAGHAVTFMRSAEEARGGRVDVSLRLAAWNEGFLAAHPDAARADHWVVSVSDDGVGMDERTLAKAFDPFFTTKDPEQGSGLGLSMVHLIARQHGGFVTAASEPGRGSTFAAYFPAEPSR